MASTFASTLFAGAACLALSAAPAFAQDHCDDVFSRSRSLTDIITKAYTAMGAKDIPAAQALLPQLQQQLDALPAVELKPEVCNANHINAYTSYQNMELSALRARGVDIGFPADLPIVKQPDLNQSPLAYSVGWIKYELADYAGAKAAYAKGLAIFPHDHALQNEYMAVLLQMGDGQGVVDYTDTVLNGTFDMDDAMRAKVYAARGLGAFTVGNLDEAESSLTVSLQYNADADNQTYLDKVRAAKAGQ